MATHDSDKKGNASAGTKTSKAEAGTTKMPQSVKSGNEKSSSPSSSMKGQGGKEK